METRFRLIVTLMLTMMAALPALAQAPVFDEYQVKAAYLFNFARFVEWPASAFSSPSDPIRICIAGQSPFGSTLEEMTQGKRVGDRPLVVQRCLTHQSGKCQLLFIGAKERKRIPALLDELKGTDVLTVGETDDFTAIGGMIGLKLDGTHVRIQVALETTDHAGLRISSKLLGLVEIVKKRQ